MDVLEFNNHLNQMLEKVSKERKQIFLLGDFNINLLNYNVHQPTKQKNRPLRPLSKRTSSYQI